MIDSLATFQSTFNDIPVGNDKDAGADAIAAWINDRVTSKMSLPGITGVGLTYTFDQTTFATSLKTMSNNNDKDGSIDSVAGFWKAALGIAAVAAGSSVGTPSPATTWSVVNTTVIDAPSQTAGEDKMKELKTADISGDSPMAEKSWEAFLLLTITTSGLNSVSPTPGPLLDPARAVA